MNAPLDIAANRKARKWTRREQIGRLFWALAQPAFRFSPKPCWGWRRWLLRWFGAHVGRNVQIHPRVRIEVPWNLEIGDWSAIGFDALVYNLGRVRIGQRVTVSQRTHLCAGTHDFSDPALPLRKTPITIHDDVWVCADVFVGPGVEVGAGAVLGARAVVVRNVEAWAIVAGNPAVKKGQREIL